MNTPLPERHDDVGDCVDAALRRVGKRIVLATPLAIGKPNAVLNEFFRRVARDPSLHLTIVTALSLNRPVGRTDLEQRFLGPMVERVFGDYPDLEYVRAARAGRLPPNIRVREFYVQAGAWLGIASAQQDYISINYSQVVQELAALGVNVLAQQVAARSSGSREEISLSANPDLSLDLLQHLSRARAAGSAVVTIGSINRRLPFMLGDAVLAAERFDLLLDHARYEHDPYAPPNLAIHDVEHALGLNAAALVRDGGTLQLGIGELGEACTYALQLRQQRNDIFRTALRATGVATRDAQAIADIGGLAPLERGLYACTEMFIDGFLELYRNGILSRRVYPHALLQRLLDAGTITERIDVEALVALHRAGIDWLEQADFDGLLRAGLFAPGTRLAGRGLLLAPDGTRLEARLGTAEARQALATHCLARRLEGGRVLHAGFLLGPRGFYGALRELAEDDRQRFDMTRISFTNVLHGPDQDLKIAQRRDARFINTTMMVTGLGAAVSDGLESGQVVSGVGGQHDFVTMAHQLPGARSILLLRSTRSKNGRVSSNLPWSYGHVTIPRHLRDVVVTEYGIADLRGRTDRDCVAALIAIADSRFQPQLLADARRAGKIEAAFRIPDERRHNLPGMIATALGPLRAQGLFSEFPFGTDFTAEEIVLAKALERLQSRMGSASGRLRALAAAVGASVASEELRPYLERMGLAAPSHWRQKLTARLVAGAVDEALEGR